MNPAVILIPPSEGKAPAGTGKPLITMHGDALPIYDRLLKFKGDFAQLYGVKGKALESARLANAQLLKTPTLPAIVRYSGVVYGGINYATLSNPAQQFFNTHVRIVSALFGLLSAEDPIPDYKLKIEKLDAACYWKPIISKKLKGFFVIDLLPQTHQKAVAYETGVKVDFIVVKNGKSIPAGHQGKLIKGKFLRSLCEHAVTDPKKFSGFKQDGFSFDGNNFVKKI
jgi:cytoplasmic iron level regulating protein YaaA (DUF328/UPF0246 family)